MRYAADGRERYEKRPGRGEHAEAQAAGGESQQAVAPYLGKPGREDAEEVAVSNVINFLARGIRAQGDSGPGPQSPDQQTGEGKYPRQGGQACRQYQ